DEILVVLPEEGPVEVGELNGDAAVEARRQTGRGIGEAVHLEGAVAPPQEGRAKNGQQEKDQEGPAAPPAPSRGALGHENASFRKMRQYSIAQPGGNTKGGEGKNRRPGAKALEGAGKLFHGRMVDISWPLWYSWKVLCYPGPARVSPKAPHVL